MADFSQNERLQLLRLARETIRSHLEGAKPEAGLAASADPRFAEKRGVFVTLHIRGQLRGCIGYPLPIKPLWEAVADNALSAAFEDPRFPPLSKNEFKDIDIEISVLTVPREIGSPEEVKIGRDGIIISKGFHRGLLLPQVPVEQGWNLEEYLSYGCLKAGLSPGDWSKGVKIEIFQAEVFGEKETGAG